MSRRNAGWLRTLETIVRQIDEDGEELHELAERTRSACKALDANIKRANAASSGSWIGYQADLYYGDFEPPPQRYNIEWGGSPDGWFERNYDDVLTFIERDAELTVAEVQELAANYREQIETLRDEISVALAPAADHAPFADIAESAQSIASWNWSPSMTQLLQSWQPTSLMTRDSSAVSQNFQAPAHRRVDAAVQEITRHIASGDKLLANSRTLVRQLIHRLEVSDDFMALEQYARWRSVVVTLDVVSRPFRWLARRVPEPLLDRIERHPAVRLVLLVGALIGVAISIAAAFLRLI